MTNPQSMPIPNTLGVPSVAAHGVVIDSIEALQKERRRSGQALRVLGEGSNVIVMPEVQSPIGFMRIKGFTALRESGNDVYVYVAAGESWHTTVMRCLDEGWYGIENLALIPGSVGAAPVQNIGAYGVEVGTHIDNVAVVDAAGKEMRLSAQDCEFAYRDSIFKREADWTIVGVTLRLSRNAEPVISYPDVQTELSTHGGETATSPSPEKVAQAVMAIRRRKLPDPATTPNAGSFFKNPIVSDAFAKELAVIIPGLVCYPQTNGTKLSAAQLIDQRGWKGRANGEVTVSPSQALVIVNPGRQSATDVLAFAQDIRRDIKSAYGVELELEPSLVS